MDKSEAKIRIAQLRDILNESNRRYYVDNKPIISDYEFDTQMHELEALEREFPEFDSPDSPTHKVGSDIAASVDGNAEKAARTGFVQRPHRYPMLSLSNTYSISEIEDFVNRAENILGHTDFSYSCELKFDGTAICLNYTDGKLASALTRGDGIQGDDVTENALRITNIPHSLQGNYPEDFEIRGEVLMPFEAFESLNREREENGEAPFANPRNAASGSLKLIDPEEVAHRGLICTLYQIPAESAGFSSHKEALDAARSWGLPVSDERKLCRNIEEIREYINFWDSERHKLPFATDGIVIKINESDSQRSLGYTAKSPRWAVAYKFKAESACTKLLSIDYQVGRTGAITPVANLEPVALSGTIVKRASLNNEDFIRELDIHLGDHVYVEKGGEIIPKITGVELSERGEDAVVPEFPKFCPDCGSELIKEEGAAKHYCPNSDNCPMQIKGKMIHFVGRKAMDILAGEQTIEQLYDAKLAKTPADFYDIMKYQLVRLEGWQNKAAERFLDSLEASKKLSFERVLFAMGIRHVGETSAKTIARHFGSIDRLIAASKEELLAVPDVGEATAEMIYNFLRDEKHLKEISRLRNAGLQFELEGEQTHTSDSLKDKIIVISGNFSISRDEMKELVSANGGKNSSSISKNTSFLLAGSKPGPEKLRKCEELGIPVMGEEEFMSMLPQAKRQEKSEPQYIELSLF